MVAMGIFSNRPALRWLAPAGLVLVVGGTGLVATTANADPSLSPKSAEQLLVDVQKAQVDGLSGTVTQTADLGLPGLPPTGGATSEELTSLLSGNHTLRVWYAGPDKSRVAVLDKLGETDVVVNGTSVWTWASRTNEATHRVLPEHTGARPRTAAPTSPDIPKTPEEAAQLVLKAVGTTTNVSTDASVKVADRDAYALVLTPKDDRSKIGQVRIAVDAKTSVPLKVEVLSTAGDDIATVGYDDVTFAKPDDGQFAFNPPKDAKVTEAPAPAAPKAPSAAQKKAAQQRAEQAKSDTKTYGEGWTKVVVTKVPADAASSSQLAGVVTSLPRVEGQAWGSGRLFEGTAFSAVLTDDGRLAVGAVKPDLLYAALAK